VAVAEAVFDVWQAVEVVELPDFVSRVSAVNGGSTRISKPQEVQVQFRVVGCQEWEYTEVRRQSQVLIPVICDDPAMKLGRRHGGVLFSWSADHVF
jgi:hypothetical protein